MGPRCDAVDTQRAALFTAEPRQVNRHMLLRGLAEEIVYEDSVAQLYAGRLAAVICDGNPVAQREYEHMLAQERQKAKSLGPI